MKKFVQPGYNDRGEEIPDPTPVEVPLGFRHPPTLQEEIQRLVRNELSRAAADAGGESFEEADDFYVEDEEEWASPYELTELQEEFVVDKALPNEDNVVHGLQQRHAAEGGTPVSGGEADKGEEVPVSALDRDARGKAGEEKPVRAKV